MFTAHVYEKTTVNRFSSQNASLLLAGSGMDEWINAPQADCKKANFKRLFRKSIRDTDQTRIF